MSVLFANLNLIVVPKERKKERKKKSCKERKKKEEAGMKIREILFFSSSSLHFSIIFYIYIMLLEEHDKNIAENCRLTAGEFFLPALMGYQPFSIQFNPKIENDLTTPKTHTQHSP